MAPKSAASSKTVPIGDSSDSGESERATGTTTWPLNSKAAAKKKGSITASTTKVKSPRFHESAGADNVRGSALLKNTVVGLSAKKKRSTVQEVVRELTKAELEAQVKGQEASRDRLVLKAKVGEHREDLAKKKSELELTLSSHKILEEELILSREEIVNIKGRLAECKRQIIQMKEEIDMSTKEKVTLFAKVHTAQDEIKDMDVQRAQLIKELFHHRQKLSTSKAEQAQCKVELNNLTKEKKNHQSHVEALEQAVDILKIKVEEAKLDKADAHGKSTELCKIKVQLEHELGTLDRERTQLKEKCGVTTQDIASRQNQIGRYGHENNMLNQKLRRMEDMNKALHERVLEAERHHEELRKNMNAVEEARNHLAQRSREEKEEAMEKMRAEEEMVESRLAKIKKAKGRVGGVEDSPREADEEANEEPTF